MTLNITVGAQRAAGPHCLSEQMQALLKTETKVVAMTGYYLVMFPKEVQPQHHLVRKDKTCACESGVNCAAVLAVADYLKAGGQRATEVSAHHLIPAACPVCGGTVKFAPRLCSPVRGAGWACTKAAKTETSVWPEPYHTPGESHYWQFMWNELAAQCRRRHQRRNAYARTLRESAPMYGAQPLLMEAPYHLASQAILPVRERPNYRLAADSRACNLLEVLTVLVGREETAKALLAKYGSASVIANTSVLEMARSVRGVSQALATRIKAAAEFGRRAASEWPEETPVISSPADCAAILTPLLQDRDQEYLYVLNLNTRNRLIGQPIELYHGALNTSLIRVSEVFREAIRLNAASIIIGHNHPSNDPSPSPEDVAVTRALIEAGKLLDIALLDHIVCARHRFVSLKERGLAFSACNSTEASGDRR